METISTKTDAEALSAGQNEFHLMMMNDGKLYLGTLHWTGNHIEPTPLKLVQVDHP